jgi:hypothetical protein
MTVDPSGLDDFDDDGPDDLDLDIEATEAVAPGHRAEIEKLTEVFLVTTALWRRREELGLTPEEVAERSGLSLDEVESIENNALDTPAHNLSRYASAVGLHLDLRLTAA